MKQIAKLFSFLLLSCVIVSCAKDIVDLTGSINGVVKDYNTAEVISNCQVTLGSTGENSITGTDGFFHFNNVDPGTYSLIFKKAGYVDFTKSITVIAGTPVDASVLLTAKSSFELSETTIDFEESQTLHSVVAYNYSAKECSFSINNIPNWASISPTSGKIEANGKIDISVSVDRSLVNEGAYHQDVKFVYNQSNSAILKLSMKKVELKEPTVSISASAGNISRDGFSIVGEIKSTGGSEVTKYGHCWSTKQNPTITENVGKTEFGPINNSESFKSDIKNLEPGTTYHVRAYAVNSVGVSYSDDITVKTESKEETGGETATLSVSPQSISLLSTGSQQKVTVSSNGEWLVKTNENWIKISTTTGKGNGSFVISASENTGERHREGTVYVSSGTKQQTINVTQNGEPELSVTNLDVASGGTESYVTVTSDVSWTAQSNATWASLDKTSGNGSGTIKISVAPNSGGDNRSCKIVFTFGNITKTLSIAQHGASAINKEDFNKDKKY